MFEIIKIEVIYKCGIVRTVWVSEFTFDGEIWKWTALSNVRPLFLGDFAKDVAAVWQLDSLTFPSESTLEDIQKAIAERESI